MTIHQVVETLEAFKDEYKDVKDPEVKKLCGFVTNTINILNAYIRFFTYSKARIQRSQQYYEEALVVIDQLIEDVNSAPAVPGSSSNFNEESGLTLEDFVNDQH